MNSFPCTSCGQCCRNVHYLLDMPDDGSVYSELIRRFPYNTNEDGSCEMLTDDGLCSVYENRPLLCNLKLAALLVGYTNDDWMKLQATECNSMIKEAGLDEKYKVMVDKF